MKNSPVVLRIENPEEMARLGARVAQQLTAGDLVLLTGELGAGKTTFARGLGEALGVRGAVTSPTFVLARTHPRAEGPPLVHVDAYRLTGADELDDLDLDLERSIVVVEWGAGLIERVADEWLAVTIERPMGATARAGTNDHRVPRDDRDLDPDDAPIEARVVTISGVGPRWGNLGWLHAAGD